MAEEARPASIYADLAFASASTGRAGRPSQDVATLKQALLALLSSRTVAHDDELPRTGVGLDWERLLSPILIAGENYGTRCSTALILDAGGQAFFSEWTRDAAGEVAGQVAFEFDLDR